MVTYITYYSPYINEKYWDIVLVTYQIEAIKVSYWKNDEQTLIAPYMKVHLDCKSRKTNLQPTNLLEELQKT